MYQCRVPPLGQSTVNHTVQGEEMSSHGSNMIYKKFLHFLFEWRQPQAKQLIVKWVPGRSQSNPPSGSQDPHSSRYEESSQVQHYQTLSAKVIRWNINRSRPPRTTARNPIR